jgi:DNA-binding SARP family transcriptional activator/CBS domain-containing protein
MLPAVPSVPNAVGRAASDRTTGADTRTRVVRCAGLQFSMLGPLEVVDDNGRALDLGTPRQRAVLAILVLHANHVVSLDRLIDELWGDTPPSAATSTLQAYVSNLRRVLEPDRPPRAPATVLVSNPPGYLLRCEPADIDAVRFGELTTEGRAALAAGDARSARATFEAALALWRGPVLADFAYESFTVAETARLDELRASTQEDYVDALLACGDDGVAIAELERLVADEPLRERRRAQQMLALYRSGRQADALRAYEQVRRDLTDGLGIDPSPALNHLHHQILDQEAGLTLPAPAIITPSEPVAPVVDEVSPRAEIAAPFVGRDDALVDLIEVLDRNGGGQCRAVVITGEAGIGKTRLVQAFGDTVSSRGWSVSWGRCHDDEGAPPLWPWSQSLRRLVDEQPEIVSAGDRDVLAQLLPELGDASRRVDDGDDVEAARFRQFEAVTRTLERAAAARPALIVLDDLHWSDASSLRLLRFVATYARTDRLLIAITARDTEPASKERADALAAAIETLVRQPAAAHVALHRLRRDDVDELLKQTTGAQAAADLVDRLYTRTGGNPFFVTELVKLLASERTTGPDPVSIPTAVSDVVRRRLARLPDDTQALLRVAAICGRVFEVDTVADACRVDVGIALDQLESALLTGVVESGDGAALRFSHALVSETIEAELSPVRRARLHVEVAHALISRHGRSLDPRVLDAHLPDISRHLAAAGPAADPAEVIEYATRAGDLADRRLAFEEEVIERERVVEARARISDALDTERLADVVALGRARLKAGDLAGARALQVAMLDLAQRIGDIELLGETALAYGSLAGTQWRALGVVSDEMVAALERVLDGLPAGDSALRARAMSRLGIELYYSPTRRREGVEGARAAAEMAQRLGDPALLAQTLHGFIVAAKVPDETAALRDAARALVALGRASVPDDLHLAGRVHELRLSLRTADVDDFSRSVAELVAETERRRDPTMRTLVAWAEVTAAFFRADLETAEAKAWEAAQRHDRSGAWGSPEAFALHLDLIRREQGRAAEVDEALQRMGETRGRMRLLHATGAEAVGDLDRARALFPDDPLAVPYDYGWLPYVASAARVAAATRHPTASRIYDAMLPFRSEVIVLDGTFVCLGSTELYLGTLAEAFAPERAAAHLEAAIRVHDAICARPWSARARIALARAVAADDPSRALDTLDAAESLIADSQLVKLLREIDELRATTKP